MNRTQELEEQILYHNDKYFNDEPEISDVEYDSLIEELRKLDPTNSALVEVGATPSYGKRVVHDRIMGSLIKKTFVIDDNGDIIGDGLSELRKWEGEHPEKKKWGYKIDGLAGKLIYKNAKLLVGVTRGNGCLDFNSLVELEDGRTLPIGKIVEDNIQCNVKCKNIDTNKIEYKPILSFGELDNDDNTVWVRITVRNASEEKLELEITDTHPVWNKSVGKYVQVKDLKEGDCVCLDEYNSLILT